jgi:DNA polymerase IV
VCRTVVLRLRFDDFARATKSHTLPEATAETETILRAARELLAGARPLIAARGLTLVGVSLTGLEDDGAVQLALPLAGEVDRALLAGLDSALDAVRDRYGPEAVTRAVLLGRAAGPVVPLLPD